MKFSKDYTIFFKIKNPAFTRGWRKWKTEREFYSISYDTNFLRKNIDATLPKNITGIEAGSGAPIGKL